MSGSPREDFWIIVKRLNGDVNRCLTKLQTTPKDDAETTAFWRRMYARAVFGVIDAAIHQMAFSAYITRKLTGVTFSPDELTRLEDLAGSTADPMATEPPDTSQTLADMEFAFNSFARVHFSDYVLPTNDPAYVLVQATAALKHLFQDPRQVRGLTVRDEDVGLLGKGLQWFVERMVDLQESCYQAMLEKDDLVM